MRKRDLRTELLLAEQDAKNKKRKAEGKPPLPVPDGLVDEESAKRRKLLQDALELDKDDDDEGEAVSTGEKDGKDANSDKSAERRVGFLSSRRNRILTIPIYSDDDSDSGDDDDDTAELLRELEKIKRERAEEKARLEREQSASTAAAREAEIASSNPLLNLAAALGQQTPRGVNTTVPGTFAVKKRWDDGAYPDGQPGHD